MTPRPARPAHRAGQEPRPTRAQIRAEAKWHRCRTCGHFRVEHGPLEARCQAVAPEVPEPTPLDRCDCLRFDPPEAT